MSLLSHEAATAPTEMLPALQDPVPSGPTLTELPCGGWKGTQNRPDGTTVTGYGYTEDRCRERITELMKASQ